MYGIYFEPEKETFIIKDFPVSNNLAEWYALLLSFIELPSNWKGKLYSDSLLVVNQYNGSCVIKDKEFQRIFSLCVFIREVKKLDITVLWVKRENNILGKKLEKILKRERNKRKKFNCLRNV